MNRIICFLIIVIICVSMCGCQNNNTNSRSNTSIKPVTTPTTQSSSIQLVGTGEYHKVYKGPVRENSGQYQYAIYDIEMNILFTSDWIPNMPSITYGSNSCIIKVLCVDGTSWISRYFDFFDKLVSPEYEYVMDEDFTGDLVLQYVPDSPAIIVSSMYYSGVVYYEHSYPEDEFGVGAVLLPERRLYIASKNSGGKLIEKIVEIPEKPISR